MNITATPLLSTCSPWASNFEKLVASALARLQTECGAENAREFLLDMHAAWARDCAELVALRAMDKMEVHEFATFCAEALTVIDMLVGAAIANYQSIGLGSRDPIVIDSASLIDRNFRQRFSEIIFSQIPAGHT